MVCVCVVERKLVNKSDLHLFLVSCEQSYSSNFNNTIKFSTTIDGIHGGGVEFTDGVLHIGTGNLTERLD